ncbi:MAG: glycosyltransferase family 2 protein [Planctomycetota bacterium]|nr:glycosyltransferase family 2 protein [Planctomycetota bacterium]
MDSKSNIVAVILTKNEEINIERCIESVQFCKDVVVLDSGSTDHTAEIAVRLGAKVFVHIQPPPFKISEQRNWILDQYPFQNEWILYIDADEVVPKPLSNELTRIADSDSKITHYLLTPRYLFLGKWLKRTIGYPNWHARFMKYGSTRFAGGVWEHFTSTAKSGQIQQPYDHYANSKGISDWLARHDRYSSWDAAVTLAFLNSGDETLLRTKRKLGLRKFAARLWLLRPSGRFVHTYILRLGFLEGWQALVFSLLYAFYELMVVVKIIELKRMSKKQSL